MEVMGGASYMDGDWESICRILSFDQDSHIPNGSENLLGLLMADSNPSTSQSELGFPTFNPTSFSYNIPQFNCGFGMNHGGFVNANEKPEDEDGAQISSLTMNSHGNHWMKRKHDELEIPSASNNMRKNNKINEHEQKCSSDTSENDESNGSHQLINEDIKKKPNRRANRGAATDPQSLYARKRRDRINERLRTLQSLVPNGTKVDLSTMLEEAVNYVKFLQMQIKLLSSEETWMYAPLAYNGFHVGL